MLKNFNTHFKNYWKEIDKSIFLSFLLLFILGVFFSFASTSSLAGEKLNKDYYFFFSKHLIFSISSVISLFGCQNPQLGIIFFPVTGDVYNPAANAI